MSTIESICADCSTPLQGRFCADCGAPASAVASDQVGDLVSEWAGNFLQADRDFRRTLGMLLLRPGELTTHWWAGRRRGLASPIKHASEMLAIGLPVLNRAGTEALVVVDKIGSPESGLQWVALLRRSKAGTWVATGKVITVVS
jgi:hypothetical protein